MSYAYQAAEQAFKKAQNELEIALEKFTVARNEFAKVSGKFVATDARIINSISQFAATPGSDDDYIKALTEGVKQYQADIDQEIASRSQTRELTRIPVLVRSILRLAMYEMNYLKDTPSSVIINEAVELAKRFGEEGDSRFINGLLGSYLRDTQPT